MNLKPQRGPAQRTNRCATRDSEVALQRSTETRWTHCNAHDLHAIEMKPPQNRGKNTPVTNQANPKSPTTVTCHPGMQSLTQRPPASPFHSRCDAHALQVFALHNHRGTPTGRKVRMVMTHGATRDNLSYTFVRAFTTAPAQGVGWTNVVQTRHPAPITSLLLGRC